ncbi:integral membrane protein [Lachnospiraceae bacterium TWA4]|nr:integral membrane protein [Lachnospiraceae bacterium TWA4]
MTSGVICDLLRKLPLFFTIPATFLSFLVRKAAHMSIYFVLGATLLYGFYPLNNLKNSVLFSIFTGIFYSITDEFHQGFSPGRSPQVTDVCIDSFGVILGVILFLILLEKKAKIAN